MNVDDIKSIFAGVSDASKAILTVKLKAELLHVLKQINADLTARKLSAASLCPPPAMIMNMFRVCEFDQVRIVLVGQDPYIRRGEAMGHSFSVPRGVKIPPSLRAIYDCLLRSNLITKVPEHGDLTGWARQGVLLLNCALTTVLGESNAHANEWKTYTDGILRELAAAQPAPIFILLGGFAHGKCEIVGEGPNVLKWGHPSPMNSANKEENNPKNFKYCDSFTRANKILVERGQAPINWDPDGAVKPTLQVNVHPPTDNDPFVLTISTLWLFTDGGARANGRENCRSSWAFYATDGCMCASMNGLVDEKNIPGEKFKSSNNRGELTAMARGLQFISEYHTEFLFKHIIIVSDSAYSIGSIRDWSQQWLDDAAAGGQKMKGKKNLDIILPAKKIYDKLTKSFDISFTHVHSHQTAPADTESEEWFIWKCNDIVDKLCAAAFVRD